MPIKIDEATIEVHLLAKVTFKLTKSVGEKTFQQVLEEASRCANSHVGEILQRMPGIRYTNGLLVTEAVTVEGQSEVTVKSMP